jgi:hypothetical protein
VTRPILLAIAIALLVGVALTFTPTAANRVLPPPRAQVVPLPSPPRLLARPASRDFTRLTLIVAQVPVTPRPVQAPQPPAQPTLVPSPPPIGSGPTTQSGPSGTSPGEAALTGLQDYARGLVGTVQWPCLRALWQRESGWRADADNPSSTAFGIAQRLDETSTDPAVQIRRGLDYIAHRYGDACAAWAFWQRARWY